MSDDPKIDKYAGKQEKEEERRQEPRRSASIFVEVSGFDRHGRFFSEHTATKNASERGCCFRLQQDVSMDALLAIQPVAPLPDSSGRPVLFQIAWMEPMQEGTVVGAARLHGEITWCVAFPVATESQDPRA